MPLAGIGIPVLSTVRHTGGGYANKPRCQNDKTLLTETGPSTDHILSGTIMCRAFEDNHGVMLLSIGQCHSKYNRHFNAQRHLLLVTVQDISLGTHRQCTDRPCPDGCAMNLVCALWPVGAHPFLRIFVQ